MKSFKHYNARSLKQAASLLLKHDGKAKVNAGGTDLLGSLRDRCTVDYPEALVNIKTVPRLDYIKVGSRGLRIGALARLADIARSPEVRENYSLLAEASHAVANPNVRNVATLGGNLAQDVRCWYYRYPQQIGGPITCLRKGGKICNALVGDNRYHSVFGVAPAPQRRCASHCPAHVDIPGYLRQIRAHNIAEAARILMDYNPFPAITGRVCPIFCEPQCNRSGYDEPVAVHSIERGIGDYILDNATEYFAPPTTELGKNISIVGSGPAGLAAAFYLRKSGYRVTVYEKLPEPGGMPLYSIPPFRLPKGIIGKQIQALKGMGIRFETNACIDAQWAVRITADSDAVFVAGGTWKSLKLGVPGEEAQNVYPALDYLRRINSGESIALGKRAIVIGGGSVAIDAARTARRTGVDEVHVVFLETRDFASRDRMLALDREIQDAEEEGIIIHPSLGIRGIKAIDGAATGIETKICSSVRTPEGTFNPQYDEISPSLSLNGDSIIIAIGQAAESLPFTLGGKVFIGGDMAEGPSTVIQAVASARKFVDAISRLLGEVQRQSGAEAIQADYPMSYFDNIPRTKAPETPAAERIRDLYGEDIGGLSESQIQREALRCVNCGCLAVGPSDLAIALVALNANIVTTKRTLSAQDFFAATATSSTVLEQDELVKEIWVPRLPKDAQQRYLKFTIRKPIDFAVVSVASVITERNGVCAEARITLGAVAPTPIRAMAAENSIIGKRIDENSATEAAKEALAAARPLGMNQYKVDIARTLVKRAILRIDE